ncbi:hypothetical protein [Nonomuraea maheshkhaliensis]|uniref:hypothetical protein n=1 Tax=Nonomuraea maheshkhaliensis TaxID=419590 RepID=UPI0031F98776
MGDLVGVVGEERVVRLGDPRWPAVTSSEYVASTPDGVSNSKHGRVRGPPVGALQPGRNRVRKPSVSSMTCSPSGRSQPACSGECSSSLHSRPRRA